MLELGFEILEEVGFELLKILNRFVEKAVEKVLQGPVLLPEVEWVKYELTIDEVITVESRDVDKTLCTLELELDFVSFDVVFIFLDVIIKILQEDFAELDALGAEVGLTEDLMLIDKFLKDEEDNKLPFEFDLEVLLLTADVLEDFAVVE